MNLFYFPIARIGLWFVSGIVYAYYCKPSFTTIAAYCIATSLVFMVQLFQKKKLFKRSLFFGISLYLLFFSLGISTVWLHDETNNTNHYTKTNSFLKDNLEIEVFISDKLKNSAKYTRYIAEVTRINQIKTSGKILVTIKKKDKQQEFVIGTPLVITNKLQANSPPNNPDQFDYSRYLVSKNIYVQVHCEKADIKIGNQYKKDIFYYAAQFRNTILDNLKKKGFHKEELAVMAALILGQQQDISPEIMQEYQYAGAVHILSVSGLHVGFILLILTFLLKPLPKNTLGNMTRCIIILTSLWLFACVAGLAPSVIRSVTMYSFVTIGMLLQREINIYRTLTASLFLILLFEPLFLFDVGFQLSYLALFFIVWFQPVLRQLWQPRHKINAYLWDLLTVSFAAQIGTLPLSLYYFHQFPSLFFVTNIVLIPCLSVVMFLGVLTCLLAYWDITPLFLVQIMERSIHYVNAFIKWIASWEQFIMTDIPLHFYVLIASYLLLFSSIIWMKNKSFQTITMFLSCGILFMGSLFFTKWTTETTSQFLVFHTHKKTVLVERNGRNIRVHTNEKVKAGDYTLKNISAYATTHYAKVIAQEKLRNTYFFNQKKIMLIDSTGIYQKEITPDAVILSHSPKINLERLLKTYHPKIIIADASNFRSYVAIWKATCSKEKIPFHNTYEKGFYEF